VLEPITHREKKHLSYESTTPTTGISAPSVPRPSYDQNCDCGCVLWPLLQCSSGCNPPMKTKLLAAGLFLLLLPTARFIGDVVAFIRRPEISPEEPENHSKEPNE